MEGKIDMAARRQVTNKLRSAYVQASKRDKGLILRSRAATGEHHHAYAQQDQTSTLHLTHSATSRVSYRCAWHSRHRATRMLLVPCRPPIITATPLIRDEPSHLTNEDPVSQVLDSTDSTSSSVSFARMTSRPQSTIGNRHTRECRCVFRRQRLSFYGTQGVVTERALSADGGGHEPLHRLVDVVSDVDERLIRYDRPERTATSLRAVYDVSVTTQSGVGADDQHF